MEQTSHARIGSGALTMHGLTIRFHRTLRVPGDGRVSALPPSLGTFPLHRVDDAPGAPDHWRRRGGVFLCMHAREAMWLSFGPAAPVAVKVGVGGVNAVTGDPWRDDLDEEQDYMVAPPQPWLDGVVGDAAAVSQFVAVPLGSGHTVEGQITAQETVGGMQIAVYPARPGALAPPPRRREPRMETMAYSPAFGSLAASEGPPASAPPAEMGIAPGGAIRQHVYDDPHGHATWDAGALARAFVHIIDVAGYRAITGAAPPPTPVTYEDYVRAGLPWFDVYDEGIPARPAGHALRGLTALDDLEADDAESVRDGDW